MPKTVSRFLSLRTCAVVVTCALGFVACGGSKASDDGDGEKSDASVTAKHDAGTKDAGKGTTTKKDGGGATTGDDDGSAGDDNADADVDASPPPPECTKGSDCPSSICLMQACQAPTCSDGAKNQDETDIDCGGATCTPCDVSRSCGMGSDCLTKVCADLGMGQGMQCQPPTCTDMVQNGQETGQDCGGTICGKCPDGQGCGGRSDCTSGVCTAGTCQTHVCNDGQQNGTETDVDCGGFDCQQCPDHDKCLQKDDCSSEVCTGNICQVPTSSDHAQNGSETDVDCGGGAPTHALPCGTSKKCIANSDCTSQGCDYNNLCADRRSCTALNGGQSCGSGGAGGTGVQSWESCCTSIPVTVTGVGTTNLDKYKVTAGRMRAFLESVGGNVRGFVQTARAAGKIPKIPNDTAHLVLDANWDPYLPTSMEGSATVPGTTTPEITDCGYYDTSGSGCTAGTAIQGFYTSAYRHVGGTIFRGNSQSQQGCSISSPGTHTYWMDAATQAAFFGDKAAEVSQADDDTKALQCVDYLVGQAFCVWDGGRLETTAEAAVAYGAGTHPWGDSPQVIGPGTSSYTGCRFPSMTDAILKNATMPGMMTTGCPEQANVASGSYSIEYGNYNYSYEYPQLGPNNDFAVFISAPGRLPKSAGPLGHQDVSYDVFEYTSTVGWNASPFSAYHYWVYTGSWEGHAEAKGAGITSELLNKYGKSGLRCAH